MAYGSVLTDVVQSSTAGTPPQFNDGNGTQIGTLCRAWVNFNGTTSPGTIRASFNVTSVTKNATGDYTVNFTTAMPDTNYAVTTALTRDTTNNNFGMGLNPGQATGSYYATTFVRMYASYAGAATLYDLTYAHVAIFR